MKRILSALLVSLLIPALAVGCADSETNDTPQAPDESTSQQDASQEEEVSDEEGDEPGDTEDYTFEKDQIIMATEASFRPYEYYEGTEVVGVDVDIAREIAAALGVELVVEEMEFGAITAAVNSGKADFGAAGMSITEERLKEVDFSIEYATSKQIILTTSDGGIQSADDLNGKDVGVQLGTVGDYVMTDDYPDVNVVQYNKYTEAASDLKQGRIVAIVMDVLPAQELLPLDERFVILDEELMTDRYAFCVKKDNEGLLNVINEVMQRLVDEGKIEEFTTNHSA